jgi:hypothetical protein
MCASVAAINHLCLVEQNVEWSNHSAFKNNWKKFLAEKVVKYQK